jgi:hypothetical protein
MALVYIFCSIVSAVICVSFLVTVVEEKRLIEQERSRESGKI